MLQQTGVERVRPKYAEFLERFPTLADLAAASRADVIRAWAPLGYNRRAVALHEIAAIAVREGGGQLPADRAALRRLKGIGDYTAGAIACFAFGDRRAFLDTNIRRVLGRIVLGSEPPRGGPGDRAIFPIAEALVPEAHADDWHQALMDLGALICRAAAPACLVCPVRADCRFAAGDQPAAPARRPAATGQPFVGSNRYYRGRVVDHLRRADPAGDPVDAIGRAVKPGYAAVDREWLAGLLAGLERDGLIHRAAEAGGGYRLAGEGPAASSATDRDARPAER